VGILSRRSNLLSHWNSPWVLSLVSIGGIVFITELEKRGIKSSLTFLEDAFLELLERVKKLEELSSTPKKRGRPFGSKNKVKK